MVALTATQIAMKDMANIFKINLSRTITILVKDNYPLLSVLTTTMSMAMAAPDVRSTLDTSVGMKTSETDLTILFSDTPNAINAPSTI